MRFRLEFLKKNQSLILHAFVWGFVFALPYIFTLQMDKSHLPADFARKIFILNIVMIVIWAAIFYSNTRFFIPRLLYREGIVPYVATLLGLLIIVLLINRLVYDALLLDYPYSIYKALSHNTPPFVFFVLIAIAFKTVNDRLRLERESKDRESENLKTELAFLRSQISPHFLFNVLNNMVSLVRMKSDELEPTILKLSSLLQYMLYETHEKVLLKDEVEYLQSYIDLQQLRFGDRLNVKADLDPKENGLTIEPMLLIPFVENAFKHGTGMIKDPAIDISLATVENELVFVVENKFIEEDKAKDKVSGIGLANVKRRLELLYGKNHQLNIDKTNDRFTIILKLYIEP